MTTPIVPSITDEQLAELEQLAGKATKGEWWIDSHGHTMVSHGDGVTETIFSARDLVKPAVRHPETWNLSHWPNDWDASYIATACPQNIQGLIARLRAAEADAKRYRFLRAEDTSPGFLCNNDRAAQFMNEYMACGDKMDALIDAQMENDSCT